MFNVGERVIGVRMVEGINIRGLIGTVLSNNREDNEDWIAVQFDKGFSYGHDCDGSGESGRCYYVSLDDIKSLNNSKISISDITTEYEKKKYSKRSLSSLARGLKCSVKDIKSVMDVNTDIFSNDGKFYERILCME